MNTLVLLIINRGELFRRRVKIRMKVYSCVFVLFFLFGFFSIEFVKVIKFIDRKLVY